MKCLQLPLLVLALTSTASAAPASKPLKIKSAAASSSLPKYAATNAIDGKVADDSRWVSEKSAEPSWIAIDLGEKHKLNGIHLFTGFGAKDVVEAFKVQFWSGGKGVAYVHFLPSFKEDIIWKNASKYQKATLLRTGEAVPINYQNKQLRITLPPAQRTANVEVVKLE